MLIDTPISVDMPASGIYAITCRANGRIYIGQSTHIQARIRSHVWDLSRGRHSVKDLQSDFDAFGLDEFEFAIVERVADTTRLISRENRWIWICSFRGSNVYNSLSIYDVPLFASIPWTLRPKKKRDRRVKHFWYIRPIENTWEFNAYPCRIDRY